MDKELFIPNTELKIFADKGEFSFGVDSILLINFAKIKSKATVLDIGAGTGILSLGIFEKFFLAYGLKTIIMIRFYTKISNFFSN